ncbi:MAG: lytic transglycosylase domain-containing protein [Clostridia bacterium]|nr:lytic transglycosylase domain-containing protein [Clostridia bacterium]
MTTKGKIRAAMLIFICVTVVFSVVFTVSSAAMKLFYPIKYENFVEKYSAEYEVDPRLIYAIIKTESSFNPEAVSSADAEGLTQITPETFEWLKMKLGEKDENISLFDPETSIKYGTYFISLLLDEFGETNTALAAYHAGRGRINEWLENPEISPDGKTLSDIPVPETAHYVKKVNKAYNVYNKIYTDSKQKGQI